MPNAYAKKRFTRVSTIKSEPVPFTARDTWSTGEVGCCPTSDHRKKYHKTFPTHRITVTTTCGDGQKSKSYIDRCKCQFFGFEWEQEWMPAGI